jgi:EAL domain-containing protein (putative c-di-GMP-specific phosphodiesterase class I)
MIIVKAIIEIEKILNMTVLAVGLETSTQHDALIQLGHAGFQRYLFGKSKLTEKTEIYLTDN